MEEIAKIKNEYTTLSISKASSERLTKFCKKNKIKKSDFIKISLDYFTKNSIDP